MGWLDKRECAHWQGNDLKPDPEHWTEEQRAAVLAYRCRLGRHLEAVEGNDLRERKGSMYELRMAGHRCLELGINPKHITKTGWLGEEAEYLRANIGEIDHMLESIPEGSSTRVSLLDKRDDFIEELRALGVDGE